MDKGWHKAGGASPLGVARAACFEELAGVFASSGASLKWFSGDFDEKYAISLSGCH